MHNKRFSSHSQVDRCRSVLLEHCVVVPLFSMANIIFPNVYEISYVKLWTNKEWNGERVGKGQKITRSQINAVCLADTREKIKFESLFENWFSCWNLLIHCAPSHTHTNVRIIYIYIHMYYTRADTDSTQKSRAYRETLYLIVLLMQHSVYNVGCWCRHGFF